MIEVEAKTPVQSLSAVRDLLPELGGTSEGVHVEVDAYYNHPCRDFSVTDEALRVRATDEKFHYLTYKGPKLRIETKTRLEMSLQLDDGELINNILEKLGFKKIAVIIKRRELSTIIRGFMDVSIMGLPKSLSEEVNHIKDSVAEAS